MVKLVRFVEEHVETTRRWLANSVQLRGEIDCLGAPSRAENKAYWRAKFKDKTREDYAIIDDAIGHIGNCGLSEIDGKRKKAQLWIYLGEKQGQGIGRRAISALLSRAFDELGLERVYLRVLANNSRAFAFYKALGFTEEGRMRHDTAQGNAYVDSYLLSMLSEEFKASRVRVARTSA
jgi:RimJ/RimL family protein N-acetyltransferase